MNNKKKKMFLLCSPLNFLVDEMQFNVLFNQLTTIIY